MRTYGLLFIGILTVIATLSCSKTIIDGNYAILYIYHNKTGESLTVSYFLEERKNTVQLSPNEKLFQDIELYFGSSRALYTSDSLEIISLNDTIKLKRVDQKWIYDIRRYTQEKDRVSPDFPYNENAVFPFKEINILSIYRDDFED